jgi:hypothetical protein
MASGPSIVAKFLADTSQLTSEVDKASNGASDKLGSFAKKASLAIGGAFAVDKVLDFGKASVDAAMADAEAQAQLASTLKNVTGATDAQIASTEDYISGLSKSAAVADDDLRPAMATLVRGFGDQEQAQKALALSTDIAAGTGKDLASVSSALAKAAMGSTGALQKLGVETKNADGSAKSLDQIMGDLSQTFSGQATVAAQSTAGQMRNAQIQFGEFQEQIGAALLPTLTALATFFTGTLIPALSSFSNWVGDHSTEILAAFIGFATVVGAAVIPSFIAWAVAAGAAAVATLVAAAPFIAIGAVIAGVAFLIINNWDTIVAATKAAWDAVIGAVKFVYDWIKNNWPLLLAIITGPIGIAVVLIQRNWDTIMEGATAVWRWVVDKWNAIKDGIGSVVGAIGGYIGQIVDFIRQPIAAASEAFQWVSDKFNAMRDAIAGVVSGIASAIGSVVSAIKAPINAVISAWNNLAFTIPSFTLPSVDVGPVHVGGQTIGGQTIQFPDLPHLATGGLTLSEGLAWLHPAEVVAPLDKIGLGGPAVIIEQATFSTEVDVDLFMDRVAWTMRTRVA